MWQGERGRCESESTGATCLSLRRSACLLVHTLSPHCKNSLLQNTKIQPQNLFFFKSTERNADKLHEFLLQNIETLWEFWYSCFASHPLNVHCISMRFLYTHNHPKNFDLFRSALNYKFSHSLKALYIYKTVIFNIEQFYKKLFEAIFLNNFCLLTSNTLNGRILYFINDEK